MTFILGVSLSNSSVSSTEIFIGAWVFKDPPSLCSKMWTSEIHQKDLLLWFLWLSSFSVYKSIAHILWTQWTFDFLQAQYFSYLKLVNL